MKKKSARLLVMLISVVGRVMASSPDFSTPEGAVRALESAYIDKDIEAAIAAKDFQEEARLMLLSINPALANDPEVLKETTAVLELSFRKEMKDNGFPDFASLRCSFSRKEEISATHVILTEVCRFPDGGTSEEPVHVVKVETGWRMVVVPPEK